ncbi:MAG: phytanoyl-CoA dioxygenase family protein [Pseudomonadota bacterium]
MITDARIDASNEGILLHPPGESDQLLHRDRDAWGGYLPRDIETQLNTMWALTDFTAENGATRVAPGSAARPKEREPAPEEIVQAEMTRGSVLFFTGSVIHAGGGNNSNDVRMGLNVDYCLDWLRQEENQYLSCPPEIARTLPQELTELMGYTAGGIALGYYSDPYDQEERAAKQAENAIGYEPRQEGIIIV